MEKNSRPVKVNLKRTTSNDPDFRKMVTLLDKELAIYNGELDATYAPHNVISGLNTIVVAYAEQEVIGCGCFKKFNEQSAEIKRMYVLPAFRKMGMAMEILKELENWAMESGFISAVLETGTKLPGTMQLYKKCGYGVIENWGQYAGLATSTCMKKQLHKIEKK
jgi:putative acetyltransferase